MAESKDILLEAIDRNAPIELIFGVSGIVQAFKSRLLSQYDDTIWLESVTGHNKTLDAMIESGQPIEVRFRNDRVKIEFSVPIKERRRAFRVNESIYVPALGVPFPQQLQTTHRRATHRVAVYPNSSVRFRAAIVEPEASLDAVPPAENQLHIEVSDFSVGGIGGIWKRRRTGPDTIVAGQRLRLKIERDSEELLLEGKVAFTVPLADPDNRKVGVQFLLDANSLDDRNKLVEIGTLMIALQNEEQRRSRMA